jgi:hypothetical protein
MILKMLAASSKFIPTMSVTRLSMNKILASKKLTTNFHDGITVSAITLNELICGLQWYIVIFINMEGDINGTN